MIYEPSYISLEWALRYYNLIPEGVFMLTACTSKKTQIFDTLAGTFSYRSLTPRLMFGYELQTIGEYTTIRIATVEKAICDYIYLHPEISGREDFEEMRINRLVRDDIASNETLVSYAQYYPKMTQQRIQYFLDYITS
jgi:predicted transcriptional regulator of viral defense system